MTNPKVFSAVRVWALIALGLAAACSRAQAQADLRLSVSNSPGSVLISNSLTYTITITNWTLSAQTIFVTNRFSSEVEIQSSSPIHFQITSDSFIFRVNLPAFGGASTNLILRVAPNQVGYLTNTVTVVNTLGAFRVSTNVPTLVTNTLSADLAVSISGPRSTPLVGDHMTYSLTVSNLATNNAPGVALTNAASSALLLLGITNHPVLMTTNESLTWSVGTLTNGEVRTYEVTAQPTNAGPLILYASVGSTIAMDPNAANNLASTNLVVDALVTNGLIATLVEPMLILNMQNGLMEQGVVVENTGTNAVAAVRLIVSGLAPTNRLQNAVGTNAGRPFVVHGNALLPGGSVFLLLQFYVPARTAFPLANTNLLAVAVSAVNLSPPEELVTPVNAARIVKLAGGNMLIEFPSTKDQSYTVVYSDDALFSNPLAAQPPVLAGANRVLWIDYGPPQTIRHPSNTTMRFYRVYQNP